MLCEAAHKFSSTQVNLPPAAAARVLAASRRIPDDAVGTEGRETVPHLTVQYGLDTENPEDVRAAVASVQPFTLRLGRTRSFPPSKHSSGDAPLFVSVVNPEGLVAVRQAIRRATKVTDTFPFYTPHVTLSYVKPDRVAEFENQDWLDGVEFLVTHITFSDRDRNHAALPLGGDIVERIDRCLCQVSEADASGVQPWMLRPDTYGVSDPGYKLKRDRLERVQSEVFGGTERWGETRRFAGRSAGIGLERIRKAEEQVNKAYERALAKHRKSVEQAIRRGEEIPAEVLAKYPDLAS